jgi:hypothetical protein
LHFYASGRRGGKTTKMVEWVRQGRKIKEYPGWSRIIVTFNESEAQRLREEYELDYHQVYSFRDLQGMHGAHRANFDVGVDNADLILEEYLRSRIDRITLTAAEWL